ncbi:hypothetical protein TURU_110042 [Turdus rufiventris]|nr:hypothetical protein TURU_110042 [Turdus rufiventris]
MGKFHLVDAPGGKLWNILSITVGGIVAISLGFLTSVYVATLHENDLWFSNIKEVEREISFRTECGLYYSYYKQMIQAASIQQGLHGLVYDNKTESVRTINILERMNVYQEVFLSILYRILPIQRLTLMAVFIATFLFSLTWQFNQFMMLIQALALFILDCLDMLPTAKKILNLESDEHIFKFLKAKFGFGATRDFDANLYLCEEAFGLLPLNTFSRLSSTLLFYIYGFVLFLLTVAAVIVAFRNLSGSNQVQLKEKMEEYTVTLKPDAAYSLVHTVLFGCLALSTMSKENGFSGDFYTKQFHWSTLDGNIDVAMKNNHSFTKKVSILRNHQQSEKTLQSIILNDSVFHHVEYRFKGAQQHHIQSSYELLDEHYINVMINGFLDYQFWPGIMDELSELREFYDPDTVELMNWIKSNTPNTAVFAGSMQLLAGVKLCTGRTLTNHPHYEDKNLRERTKQIYQIYAKRSPGDVHGILRSFGTDYVILEDSICYERRHSRGCRLRDLLDVANGHIMDGLGENEPDLKPSLYPRFCEEIKKNLPAYTMYFTRVFQNKTFHVYKLAKHK